MLCVNTVFTSFISRKSTCVFPSKSTTPISCTLQGTVAEPKSTAAVEPLLLNAVRGVEVERPPVWLMRQAGRYMKVILFSDILTPLSGMNIPFDIVKGKGPVIFDPIHTDAQVNQVREFVPEKPVSYVGEALRILRKEV